MFFTEYSMTAPELAVTLEARGFDSVWAPEHSHIPVSRKTPFPGGGDLPKQYADAMDPFVVLAAAANATKTIKLGTGVLLVQQRDTIQTAKLVASIDQVSQGRFLFGIGGGWNQDEMENHGTVFKSRFKRVRESIEAMKEIWTKPKAEYHGEFVNFDPMMAWPKPVQKPHPPIHVGGAFPQVPVARSATATAGSRLPAAISLSRLPNFRRWRATQDAIRHRSRSHRSASPRTSTVSSDSRTLALRASCRCSRPRNPTRLCRSSTVGRS